MKRIPFLLAYLLSPVIPAALYITQAGGGMDSYTLSVGLGVYAFIMIFNQLILASRPGFAVSALGVKGLLVLHGTAPFFIIAIAAAHRLLKASYGFSLDSRQATLGAIAWWTFIAAAVFALLFIANFKLPFLAGIRKLRTWAADTFKLTYKASRAFHNVTVAACAVLVTHVLLASSSDFTANPAGAAWMTVWATLALGTFLRYRIRGRPTPKIAPKTAPEAASPAK